MTSRALEERRRKLSEARIAELERALAQIAAEVTMIESGQQFNTALGLRRIKAICDKR